MKAEQVTVVPEVNAPNVIFAPEEPTEPSITTVVPSDLNNLNHVGVILATATPPVIALAVNKPPEGAPDPNAIDQTAVKVAEIKAASDEQLKLLDLASELIKAQEAGETPEHEAKEGGEMGEQVAPIDIQGQLATQMQALMMIAETLKPKNAQIVIQKQPDGSFVGQRIEDGA